MPLQGHFCFKHPEILHVGSREVKENLRPKDESAFDTDVVNKSTRKPAGDDHEAKGESVGGVDEVRALAAAGAEGVHGDPDSRDEEADEAEDGDVVEGGAVPFHFSLSVYCLWGW